MKILLLQKMIYLPTFGGANKANRMLLERLAARGHQCRAVVPAMGSHGPRNEKEFLACLTSRQAQLVSSSNEVSVFDYQGVEVHAVLAPGRTHSYVAAQIQSFNPTCILVSSEDPGLTLLEIAVEAAPARTLYIVHTPLQLPFGPHCFLPNREQTRLIQRTAGIVTVSNYVKNYIRQWGDRDSTVLAFPVYGTGPFRNLGCFDQGFVTFVNPCAYKGISLFIELAKIFADIPFAAVPTWGTTEADYANLRALPNVTLLEAADDIETILARTRVVLMPSLWIEAFPLVPVEAMLRGIPVLASNVGGLPEAKLGVDYVLPVAPIEHYENKFDDRDYPIPVVPRQDVAVWETALRKILCERVHYDRISAESQAAALRFVSSIGIEPFENLLMNLTSALPQADDISLKEQRAFIVREPAPLTEFAKIDQSHASSDVLAQKKRALMQLRVLRLTKRPPN